MTDQVYVEDPNRPGEPATLRGYAVPFNYLSTGAYEGLKEIFVPGCFDKWLATRRRPELFFSHRSVMANSDSVQVWVDSYGLAFSATKIHMSEDNLRIISSIAKGGIAQCSMGREFAANGREIELVQGVRTFVVREIEAITEITVCDEGMYQQTGVWLSSTPLHLLRVPCRLVVEWQKQAPFRASGVVRLKGC